MLLTGERGVNGEEERGLLRTPAGRLLLAAIKASTSILSSSMAASRLMVCFLGWAPDPGGPPCPPIPLNEPLIAKLGGSDRSSLLTTYVAWFDGETVLRCYSGHTKWYPPSKSRQPASTRAGDEFSTIVPGGVVSFCWCKLHGRGARGN